MVSRTSAEMQTSTRLWGVCIRRGRRGKGECVWGERGGPEGGRTIFCFKY